MHETRKITGSVKFFVQPGSSCFLRIGLQVCGRGISLTKRLKHGLCSEHATLHCGVVAFDFNAVQCPRITPYEQSPREVHFR